MNKTIQIQKYLIPKEKKAVNEFINGVKRRCKKKLLFIKLLGSKVSGNFNMESDIDLFILVKKCDYSVMHIISEIAARVNIKYDIVISPIIYGLEDHNKNIYFNTLFARELDKKGVLLYEAA